MITKDDIAPVVAANRIAAGTAERHVVAAASNNDVARSDRRFRCPRVGQCAWWREISDAMIAHDQIIVGPESMSSTSSPPMIKSGPPPVVIQSAPPRFGSVDVS